MTVYTVHAPPAAAGSDPDATRMVFVKDGFCWPALILPLPWMLFRRLWIAAAAYLLVSVIIAILSAIEQPLAAGALGLATALLLGFEGNSLRRGALALRRFTFAGVVEGASWQEAEIRFFHGNPDIGHTAPAPAVAASAGVKRAFQPSGVIGLFPGAETAR